jgi:UDP-4-amino-4-deoxy-L-arabinose formyltransferase/UDP-glucuronic acid dehydrogenase (UDP-4-keto-hexauronic acid decarboxylating)
VTTTAAPRRPVLAGNSFAGVEALDALLEHWKATDLLVIAPEEGGSHDWQASLARAATRHGVSLIQPSKVNAPEVVERVTAHAPDLLLSVYYTQIFKAELLACIHGPAINFHPSLLPRHRGTAPLIWALVDGDREAGVTAHEIALGVDTGAIVDQVRFLIEPTDTGYGLQEKATRVVRQMVDALLTRLASGQGLPTAQPQSGDASYHSRRDPSVNELQWTDPRARIERIVRALAPPLPGAFTCIGGTRVIVESVSLVDARDARAPGALDWSSASTGPLVWAGDGALRFDRVQVDGTTIAGADQPRGRPVKAPRAGC